MTEYDVHYRQPFIFTSLKHKVRAKSYRKAIKLTIKACRDMRGITITNSDIILVRETRNTGCNQCDMLIKHRH